jgi:SAM-dependent methyltransferase
LPAPLEAAGLPEARFDVVTLVNVLDQAPDPVRLLAAAVRVLRPDGLLVVRVPNGDFHRTAWAAIRRCPPAAARRLRALVIFHQYCLSARALRGLLARAGLRRIRIENAPIAGSEWSVPPGAAGRVARACLAALARSGAAACAGISGGRVLCSPSLLALAQRGGT